MFFVIDIGNTHTVAGIFDQNNVIKQWRIKTDAQMTADELAISYHNLFAISNFDILRIKGVILSSVVPQLDAAYYLFCEKIFSGTLNQPIISVCSDNVSELIKIKIDQPAEIGADRLVNGIAAFQLCKSSAIVIDFGTAITFDCISDKCEYLGGLILPGLSIALQALAGKTAKLPQIDISTPPKKVIGTNTISAMKSGVLNGYGSMIEGLIEKIRKEMDPENNRDIAVIATGGMATLIKPFAPSLQQVEPDLTLKGLSIIYQKLTS